MRRKKTFAGFLILLLAAAGAGGYFLLRDERPPLPPEAARCRLGAYRLADGGLAFVRHRQHEALRLVDQEGRTFGLLPDAGAGGRYRVADGPGAVTFDCAAGGIAIELEGWPATGVKVPLDEREIAFESHGVALRGKIVAPAGVSPAIYVALVHGSERDSAIFGNVWQYVLAAHGVGVVVYDKRGTGRSAGAYTQDFDLLADDAVAAIAELRRQAPGDYEVGLLGGSQGGWVAPLAATRTRAAFVIALYGLAEGPLAEDREEVLLGLREAGFGQPEVRAQALEVVAATGRVMASDYRSGWEELAAVREKYGKEPFFAHLEGEFTGQLLRYPPWGLKRVGPLLDVGTSWEYEPMATLRKIDVDHLWVLAGDDHEAPSGPTRELLLGLQAEQPRLDIAFFPAADHGMVIFEKPAPGAPAGGPRIFRRYAPGYYSLVEGWIASRRLPAGTADLVVASGAADAPAVPAAPAAAAEAPGR